MPGSKHTRRCGTGREGALHRRHGRLQISGPPLSAPQSVRPHPRSPKDQHRSPTAPAAQLHKALSSCVRLTTSSNMGRQVGTPSKEPRNTAGYTISRVQIAYILEGMHQAIGILEVQLFLSVTILLSLWEAVLVTWASAKLQSRSRQATGELELSLRSSSRCGIASCGCPELRYAFASSLLYPIRLSCGSSPLDNSSY